MAALLFTLLAVLLFSSTQGLNAANHGSTLKLFHVNSPLRSQSSDSWLDTLLHTQSNDEDRYKYLSSLVAGRKSVHIGWSSTYVVQAMIGTPAQKLFLAVDTNIDAGLVACRCVGGARCPRVTFNPQRSSTLRTIRCSNAICNLAPRKSCENPPNCWFTTQYNNYRVDAELVQDNITLDTYSFTNYTFGCVFKVDVNSFPVQGLLGLGRGQLSLLSQASLSTFSYCLPSFKSSKSDGTLILGPKKQPTIIKTTRLITIPKRPSLHAVKLKAIVVDNNIIYIPRGGPSVTVMDTGTVFTTLVWKFYKKVRDHVRNLMSSEFLFTVGAFDTCYGKPFYKVPTITFMFDGMNMTLPPENIIINVTGTDRPPYCLAMAPTPDNINSGLNIIASYQQQNFRVLINANSLGVVPARCSRT